MHVPIIRNTPNYIHTHVHTHHQYTYILGQAKPSYNLLKAFCICFYRIHYMSIFWFEKDANYQFLFKRKLKRRAARNVELGKGIIDVKLMEPYFELPWNKHAQFMEKRIAKREANKRAREQREQRESIEDCSNYHVRVEDDTPPKKASPPRALVASLAPLS